MGYALWSSPKVKVWSNFSKFAGNWGRAPRSWLCHGFAVLIIFKNKTVGHCPTPRKLLQKFDQNFNLVPKANPWGTVWVMLYDQVPKLKFDQTFQSLRGMGAEPQGLDFVMRLPCVVRKEELTQSRRIIYRPATMRQFPKRSNIVPIKNQSSHFHQIRFCPWCP